MAGRAMARLVPNPCPNVLERARSAMRSDAPKRRSEATSRHSRTPAAIPLIGLGDQRSRVRISAPRPSSRAPPRRGSPASVGNAVPMLPTNDEIADRLLSFSALLDLADASPYASRAYGRAAEIVRTTPAPVAELVRDGRVRELRGIGPGI